ncbi:hypothetical protein LZ31DRAFT_601537 [Colletotrichum somersetense]|nr:hypothetical protein LZ31DRAFT_601537 [Colletotrichum somersetense]
MRFLLIKHKSYIYIFRLIPPQLFPKIMCAYSRVFELALSKIERRFAQGGKRGLNLAHSEAVAMLDWLGGYSFTGHKRHLPKTIAASRESDLWFVHLGEAAFTSQAAVAKELLDVIGSSKGRDLFSSRNATWLLKLHLAIANGRKAQGGIDPAEWVGVLTGCLLAAGVEWALDAIKGWITSRAVVWLQGKAGGESIPLGAPGSLQRIVQEADIKHKRAL